jgi:hypothetical protein
VKIHYLYRIPAFEIIVNVPLFPEGLSLMGTLLAFAKVKSLKFLTSHAVPRKSKLLSYPYLKTFICTYWRIAFEREALEIVI